MTDEPTEVLTVVVLLPSSGPDLDDDGTPTGTGHLDLVAREASTLADALDLAREAAAREPSWEAITIGRGPLDRFTAGADSAPTRGWPE